MHRHILKIYIICIITLLMAAAQPALCSDWTQFQKDSSHTGCDFDSAPKIDPTVLWQNVTSSDREPCGSGGINIPPLISGNKVFVTAGNASVWAFNNDTGNLVWSRELGGSLIQTSTPAIEDGQLFVPTTEGDLYALNPETGNTIWKTHITDSSLESPITYSGHKLYIGDGLKGGNGTKYYYCYDDSGNLIWKHENKNSAGFIWSGAVVVGNYLVYPVFEGKLVCLDKNTGTFVDEVDFSSNSDVSFAQADPGMIRCSVTYADSALYTSSERGQEKGYCFKVGFNPDTGQFLNSGWAASIGFSTSTPVVYNGRVYVGHGEHGESGSLFCLDDSDGSVIWKTPVSGGVKSSPVISLDNDKPYIYFTEAINDGSIYCLNPDGTLAWHYNPPADGAYTMQGAALSDGKVYYGTDNGYLYCIGQGKALPPAANFSSDKQAGSFPMTVFFKDRSFNANKFLWDFGDGSTSTEVNPVHTYTTAGNYTVTLTVKNEHGENSKTVTDYICVREATTTWQVKNGESIQAAINAANSGDIIKVSPGEYHEVLTINKSVTLKGVKAPVLNAAGFTDTSGVTITADDVKFSGFKITGTQKGCFGISIMANGAVIENNLIDGCAEGVRLMGTKNTLRGNNISNCWNFAAILDNIGGNRLYQNTFINNNGRKTGSSNNHISGGSGSFFQSSEPVEYLWKGQKLTGYMGNYYDDYTGSDSNGDGIGDTAYAADAGTDQYPLILPFSNYIEAQENTPIPEDSWYQFHGKVDHLGYSVNGPKTNRTEWVSKDIDAITSSSPAVADGKVFVICVSDGTSGSTEGTTQLLALNESTGDVNWNTNIPGTVYGSWASPVYDNGMVFTATGPELGSYNARTGEKIWTFNNTKGTGVVNNGPAVADGMVVFSDWDGSHYYCLDEFTGDLLWSFEVKGDAQSVPAYADGKFYLTSYEYGASGHVYCVDAASGKQIWSNDNIADSLCGSPAYNNGILYLTTYSFYGKGELLALNVDGGQVLWKQSIESTDSTPACAYGNVYVCGGTKGYTSTQTYCFNATSGAPVWSTPSNMTGGWTCSVAIASGLVYVGNEKGFYDYDSLYALNATTGDIVWYAPYAGSSPALSDGMLFSIGDDQKVYAFKDSLISPVANFTANVTSGIAPLTVKFDASTSQNAASYSWDFGDGSTGTGQIIEHTFNEKGTYNVMLNATSSNGIVSSYAKVITVTSAQGPALTITKTADPITYNAVGQKIKYTYVVTNTGTVPIKDIRVTDNKIGVAISSATLSPGSSVTGTGAYTIKTSDINAGSVSNTAYATGKYNWKTVTSNMVNATVTSTVIVNPALTITKTADPITYSAAGQKITYTYVVTNSGTVPIRNIKVTDNKTNVAISSATLAPGSTVTGKGTYYIKQSDINTGSVSNSATATGTYNGNKVSSNTVTATVTSTFVPSPALTITKTAYQKTYNRVGRVITYTYIVRNTGNVPISGIKVTDNKTKVSLESSRTLTPGSSVAGGSNYVIKTADIKAGLVINSAYATGTYNGQAVNSNTVTATVTYKK